MFYKKAVLLKTSQYSQDGQENTCVESLFNSEYCKIFKSSYFEEYLRTATSEDVFMKLRKIKNNCREVYLYIVFNVKLKLLTNNRFFQHQYQKEIKMFIFIS